MQNNLVNQSDKQAVLKQTLFIITLQYPTLSISNKEINCKNIKSSSKNTQPN